MRKVEKRVGVKATTYFVRFRYHGKQTSQRFAGPPALAKRKAERFAQLIDLIGAEAALKQLEHERRAEASLTLDQVADRFFDWKQAKVRSDRTVADYRRDYRNWIRPVFGDRDPNLITDAEIQRWVDMMVAGGSVLGEGKKLEPKSVADRHAILHGIYKWAIAPVRGLVTYDPCSATELPKRRAKPPKGMRPNEWQALYAALRVADTDAADLALFLLASGWRFSEAAALNAYAVEDYDDRLFVTMGQVIRRGADGKRHIVQDAKSQASEGRRIRLDAETAAMVRRRLEKVTGDGLVFTNGGGNQWHESNFRNRIWNKAVDAANLSRRPTPHWLRHTSVAWLVMAGAKLPEIQRRIGHEDIRTTIDTYGKLIDDVGDATLDAFAAFRDQTPAGRRKQLDG